MPGLIGAVVQVTSGADLEHNLSRCAALVGDAAKMGAKLVVLPENFAFMGLKDADKRAVGEADGSGPIQDFLGATARDLKLWIVGGTMPIRVDGDGRVAAASLVFNDAGQRVARYDKIHLFDVNLPSGESYRESNTVAPGAEAVVAETPFARIGLTVCYDLRFPHLYRALAKAGADLLVVPSAFTETTGKAHWHILLRARAIEAGLFIVAAAQVGHHEDGRNTFGHSVVIDPWGEVLLDMGEEPGVGFADIDLKRISDVRGRIPALNHRRIIPEAVTL